MDKATVKELLSLVEQAVDGVVAATPNPWDNLAWRVARSTLLSDAVVDKLLDMLGIRGMVFSQIAPPQ